MKGENLLTKNNLRPTVTKRDSIATLLARAVHQNEGKL
jgi:hypothetical protein